jgi:hypothetical protein
VQNDTFAKYLSQQLFSPAWAFFLVPFTQELLSHVSADEMRGLARGAGIRAGAEMPLPPCDSLAQMEEAANDYWTQLGWGVVSFREHADHLAIEHSLAPLGATLGIESMGWAAGFLEGIYQEWFVMLGAAQELQVRQTGDADPYGGLVYRLAR